MGGCLNAIEIEGAIGQRHHGGTNDRRIFGTATGHHHVDREDFRG